MSTSRRQFLKAASAITAGSSLPFTGYYSSSLANPLDDILAQPVLKRELFPNPVIIDRLELLRYENSFLCRVTSTDGAEGISVGHNRKLQVLHPIFTELLQPFFLGKDARNWEQLLEEVYVYKSNYKMQNLALWVPLATIEFAVLDLLGQIAQQPIGALIGDIHHPEISVYQANNFRGKSAEESIDLIKQQVYETEAQAMKFKMGGRMSKNKDYPAGRSEQLIPLVRKTFGDDMVIYADSNGSYNVAEAIRIGKIMEEYKLDMYEEPVPFDWYPETKQVTEAMGIPVSGGEQEPSMRNFHWLIREDGLDIVQPDIFYFGGMVRAMKVARMAASRSKTCVPHISGTGLGYLYMMHFVSAVPNAGPYHEFKGFNKKIPLECPTSDLKSKNGVVKVPTGPGAGIVLDPDFVAKHKVVG
ncbi:mandelate racemase/muconate lactonizing enzyme family protein [Tunicatimonas pelagia]|uniref:mandelate racemase/muconate lactonizing enzyme family protein n=1 Tax=Tunicatimonas pelagia TaxID=931531 RepID=UPI00266681B5|nr:mandelate racemase/muconate lactonizing enzyme family protein [Tunicatimonas pelagia]WKN44985.1 mandelate racemase/muconate lactonizing enzyme family protein [Tunicatimonas pelagia]